MRSSICVVAVACAMAFIAWSSQAQSPIPETRVPGFGGTSTGPIANSPSAVGSNIGSNVGAGANAGPNNDVVTPSHAPTSREISELPGTSGSVTITR